MTETSVSLDQLGKISPDKTPAFISIEGINKNTGYEYSFGFVSDHPSGPNIKIKTEKRAVFLQKGTEQEAQDALITLANEVRKRTGGVFWIHPFYGAVYGTKLTPVASGFLTDLNGPDEDLTVIIYLTDKGYQFDDEWTKKAQDIGLTVASPGPKTRDFIDYQDKVNRNNPNQSSRDQAVINKLGERWDAEFKKYNQPKGIPEAVSLPPANIVKLMRQLENEVGMTDLAVSNVYSPEP